MKKSGGIDHAVFDELERDAQGASRDRLATVATFCASGARPLDVSGTGPARVFYTDRRERLELLYERSLGLARLRIGERL